MKSMLPLRPLLPALALATVLAADARAQVVVRLDQLRFDAPAPDLEQALWLATMAGPSLVPRVVIDGAPAALGNPQGISGINYGAMPGADVAIERDEIGGPLRGTLFLPRRDGLSMQPFPFEARAADMVVDEERYRAALARHYDMLAGTGLPGTPWFRRRARAFGSDLSGISRWGGQPERGVNDTFAMFTGGRALAENLRLEDVLRLEEGGGAEVPIAGVAGITVPEMSFAGLLEERPPALDPLADAVPEDQFAVFFPSFDAMVRVADELQADAAPLVQLIDRRAEQSVVRERYEQQMCLALDGLARLAGGRVIDEVALTGSDPYMRTGTDVALLLRGNVPGIQAFVEARVGAAATAAGVEPRRLEVAGWETLALETPDRRLSAWVAATRSMVVVANGQAQLRRVLETADGTHPSLAKTEEYRWFRQRYRRGVGAEDALVVVSDAAIRAWSGPHWRIASARRTLASAVLADADAHRIARAAGLALDEAPAEESPVAGGGTLRWDDGMARDSVYGTRAFLTPIAELEVPSVTVFEQRGYERWRQRFEASWGGAFDPIAARVHVDEEGTHVDMTLVPLIVRSQYDYLRQFVGERRLSARSPAPHPEALVYWSAALDREGEPFRELSGALPKAAFGDDGPLGWLGDHVTLWLDEDDAYFERIRETDSMDSFLEEALPGLPVGLRFAVESPVGAVGFLTAMRAFVEDVVPGLLRFESQGHGGREYVALSIVSDLGFGDTPTLYYVLLPEGLTLSFSAGVIERAIDRSGADGPTVDWSDRGVALHVRGEVRELADVEWLDLVAKDQLRARSWGNLAILNEWKRLGAEDPVRFHEQEWGTRLVCPGGGEYRWNAADQTMESSVFGHPGAPLEGPLLPPSLQRLDALSAGLSFERFELDPSSVGDDRDRRRWQDTVNGLRARVTLRRAAR